MNSRNLVVLMLVAAVTFAGCGTMAVCTQQPKTGSAAKGAMTEAAAGAVEGLVSGDDAIERTQHAMIGIGIWALAGGDIDNYQDSQEAKLRAELQGSGVSVTRIGDNITLKLPTYITFEPRTYYPVLCPTFFDVLTSVSKVLNEYQQTVVEVAGHVPDIGTYAENNRRSRHRAGVVAQYLNAQGVITQRLIVVGKGEHRPVADNSTAEGRRANSRVEITLVPLSF